MLLVVKLKNLSHVNEATKRDVQLANWFINMQNCGHGRSKKRDR